MRVLRIVAIVPLAILATAFFAASTSRSAAAQVAPALSHQPPAFLIGHSSSLNWAGYSSYAGNGTFTDAKGSWTDATHSHVFDQDDLLVVLGRSGRLQLEFGVNPSNSIRGFTVSPGVHLHRGGEVPRRRQLRPLAFGRWA